MDESRLAGRSGSVPHMQIDRAFIVKTSVIAARMIVAGVFVYAAVPKLLDPQAFAESIANYRVLPDVFSAWGALVLPSVELVLAAALLWGPLVEGAAWLIGALLLMFSSGMVQALVRGIDVDCGCFGSATQMDVGAGALLKNAVLLALLVCVIAYQRSAQRSHKTDPLP